MNIDIYICILAVDHGYPPAVGASSAELIKYNPHDQLTVHIDNKLNIYTAVPLVKVLKYLP